MNHRQWIIFSGCLWLGIGVMLLRKGLVLTDSAWVMLPATVMGWAKGKFVLAKTVRRVVGRISGLQLPIRVRDVYAKGYWIVIGSMMLLSMAMKVVPTGVRAFVDIAVGIALVQGALLYFRAAGEAKSASHL